MEKSQLSESAKNSLIRQHYRIVGSHSAVKTCHWTKHMIRGKGGCYKLTFYGIMSNQCMQMSTSISCANRCSYCWRDYKSPVSKEWRWDADDPLFILENSLKAHKKLLIGFKGSDTANKGAYKGSQTVKHVALSLTGEPIIYPKINELISLFNKQGISTFLVTHAQYPEQIRDLNPVTQLYVSLDGATKSQLKSMSLPLFSDHWERLNKSLGYLSKKKQRTTIRLTLVKGMNDSDLEGCAELIKKGSPDFIEVKAYMFVGASMRRLKRENMPEHADVISYAKSLAKHLPDHDLVAEHIPSRVVMLAKKKFMIDGAWHTWIDFPKYHKLVLSGKEFSAMDYIKKTPEKWVGIKG